MATVAAARIEQSIRNRSLSGMLPGSRDLCRVLGISLYSLKPALAILVRKGLILPSGSRRRYRIAPLQEEPSFPPPATKKLWVFEPVDASAPSEISPETLSTLKSELAKFGWEFKWTTETIDQTRRHHRRLNQLLQAESPDALLLYCPHRSTAEWGATCNVPTYCFGGDMIGLPLPTVFFDSVHMVKVALKDLLDLGHRDFFLPLMTRTPGFVNRIHLAMKGLLSQYDIPFVPAWQCTHTVARTPEAVYDLLLKRFSLSTPTALVGFGPEWLFPTIGFLLKHGISVPDEVSLVMLGGGEHVGHLYPEISRFDFDIKGATKALVAMITSGEREADGANRQLAITPLRVKGKTIGTALLSR